MLSANVMVSLQDKTLQNAQQTIDSQRKSLTDLQVSLRKGISMNLVTHSPLPPSTYTHLLSFLRSGMKS